MTKKYFDGKIENKNQIEPVDLELEEMISSLNQQVVLHMDSLEVGKAIDDIFDLLRRSNKYIDETTPWVLAKDESLKNRLETILYHLLEAIRVSAIHLAPFMPRTGEEILRQINQSCTSICFEKGLEYVVNNPEILFQRIELDK